MFGKSVNWNCLNLLDWIENGQECNDCAIDGQDENGNCPPRCPTFQLIDLPIDKGEPID
jgi:hypothetical protein